MSQLYLFEDSAAIRKPAFYGEVFYVRVFFPSLWSIVIIFVIIVVSFEMNVFVFMMDCVRLTGRADRERRFVGVITNRCF